MSETLTICKPEIKTSRNGFQKKFNFLEKDIPSLKITKNMEEEKRSL